MSAQPTHNTQQAGIQYVDTGQMQVANLQAVCEAVFGTTTTEGVGTWTASNTLTISDTRVTANSRIIGLTPGVNAPVGAWYIYSVGSGTFTIKSTGTELAGTKVYYSVVNPT